MNENIASLATEQVNRLTQDIDRLPTLDMLTLINGQDALVSKAVAKELPSIAKAVDAICGKMSANGRLIYCGAGTSGRLGVLDAVECKPTFGVPDGVVIALLAGGDSTMGQADEAAEDDAGLCAADLKRLDFCEKDVLVGISASGRTPYVAGGLTYARQKGGLTVALSCNPDSAIAKLADYAISPVVGPEVITGSTRMKAGTAQKMVLNMISTGVMIKLGKVYKNLMVDMIASNSKLNERAKSIVMEATGCTAETARSMLDQCGSDVKQAITALLTGLSPEKAQALLAKSGGRIACALENKEFQ